MFLREFVPALRYRKLIVLRKMLVHNINFIFLMLFQLIKKITFDYGLKMFYLQTTTTLLEFLRAKFDQTQSHPINNVLLTQFMNFKIIVLTNDRLTDCAKFLGKTEKMIV